MSRLWPVLLLSLGGCGKWEAEHWKQKFVQETNYHYQTQQIKNAEIAARELEIENLKSALVILEDRIRALEGRKEPVPAPRKPDRSIEARVTAVANEIDLVVVSAGREQGVAEGMEFRISREGAEIGRAVIDRVDARWSAAKVKEKKSDPKVGDAALHSPGGSLEKDQ